MMEEVEIPEAIRENPELPEKSGFPLPLLASGVFLLGIIGFILVSLFLPTKKQTPTVIKPTAPTETKPEPEEDLTAEPEPVPTKTQIQADLLGHLPYDIASESELTDLTADGRLKLQPAAAEKFKQMQADAKADGINLVAVSAFRDHETQNQLFFSIKEQRVQDAAKRAEVSAPPGYSEHHTGYAVDIGDGNAPETHVESSFADTAAFRWLEQNALKYSFELSFPADNEQGVSYEPWHWRFVGDRDSLEIFYKGKN